MPGESDFGSLPANIEPQAHGILLRRCLEKNPRRRWQAAGDWGAELEFVSLAPFASPQGSVPPISAQPMWRRLNATVCHGNPRQRPCTPTQTVMGELQFPVSPSWSRFSIPLTDVVAIPARFVAL